MLRVLATMRTPWGRACVAPEGLGRAMVKADCFRFRLDTKQIVPEFAAYQLSANALAASGYLATGSTRSRMNLSTTAARKIALPPVAEQHVIVSFLNHETAKFDAMVTKKERLIELLQEKRATLITRAVTKGIDTDATMTDSGVEWLGGMPEHWRVSRCKYLCVVRRGASPRPIDDPAYFDDDGEYGWVRISDVTASGQYLEKTTECLSLLGTSRSVALEPGELIVSIAASVGKPVVTKIKCCIHDGFVWLAGLCDDREFFYWTLLSEQPYAGLGKIGTQLNLNTDTIGGVWLPVPPVDEQRTIASYLKRETEKIGALVAKVHEAIDRLKELRTALIAAAVTGKIDVRETPM